MAALRIGVVADKNARFSFWERKLFSALCEDARFDFCAILTTNDAAPKTHLLLRLLLRAEAFFFAREPVVDDSAFLAALGTTPIIALGDDGEKLARLNLDVILKHNSAEADEIVARAARRGVWSLDFNAGPAKSRFLAGFWEVLEGAGVTRTALIAFPPDGRAGEIIATASFNTKFCATRNAAFIKDKSVPLLLRELARTAAGAADIARRETFAPRARPTPGPLALLRYGVGVARNLANRVVAAIASRSGARPGMWFLRAGDGDILDFDPASGYDIIPYGDQYWADPFLISENGESYVFFEDYEYRTKLGAIAVGKLGADGFTYLGVALRTPYHLSFPFVFRHRGEIFMLPETVAKKRLELWRCVEFPLQWTLHATSLEGVAAADSVLFEHGGEWWLFTNVSTDAFGDHCSDLHIYRVDGPSLANPVPHRFNPVVTDSATGRNGGRVFERGGKLYRTSQNNAFGAYGYGVNLMEIETLSLDDYRERVVRRITPDFRPDLIGCHHIDALNSRWVLDARTRWGGFPRRSR